MSVEEWYLHKAEQCERMAADASDRADRVRLEVEAGLWREIARDIAKTKSIAVAASETRKTWSVP
jgi:hypothetical protein